MTDSHNRSSADIVERLRNRDAIVMSGLFHAIPVMREAADEIERLRHDLDRHMQIATDLLNDAQPVAKIAGADYIVKTINHLREEEGDSVTILCDNPDFNGQPNCAIECNGQWTGWEDKRFVGADLIEALSAAYLQCVQLRAAADYGAKWFAAQPPAAPVETGPMVCDKCNEVMAAAVGLPISDAYSSAGTEHADWADDDYRRARDCMLGILRDSAWTITKGRDEKQFDNAFQHAVGILSLTARRLPDPPQISAGNADDILSRLDDHALLSKAERMQAFKDAAAEIRRLRDVPQPVRETTIEECAKHLEHEADVATNSLHCGDNSATIAATHRVSQAYYEAAKSIRSLSLTRPPLLRDEGDKA